MQKTTWTVMGILLNMFGQGMVVSYPSILLPALLSPGSEIKTDLSVASWAASCIGISSIPGYFISALLMDWYGRKVTNIVVIIPAIIGWFLIYIASNIFVLIFGRILSGLACGAAVILGAVSVGEYTSPKNRGMFLNLKTTAVCLGNMTVHVFGHFIPWKYVALVAMVPHIVAFLIILTWPESPAWLASKNKFENSERSFYWLRGRSVESEKELEHLFQAQKERTDCSKPTSIYENVSEFCNKFTKKDFIKPVMIMAFGGILLEACGRHNFPAYASQIIGAVIENDTNSYYYTLGIDIIISASSFFSAIFVKLMKRRILLFSSGFAALFVLSCVCLYLYLTTNGVISKDRPWIALMLFSIYFILSNLGCTPIPLAIMGEIFPLAHRSAGAAVSGFTLSLCLMVAIQVTPYLLISVNVYGTFAVFGSAMGLSLVVLYFILPETKDRTLQEIEDYFNFGRFKSDETDNDHELKERMISYPN